MRLRPVGSVLTLVFAAACATAPEPVPAPAAAAQVHAPTLAMAGDHGGWTPDEALLRRALRVWDSGGPGPGDKETESLPLAERVQICRAGLRLENRAAAAACAGQLEWQMLDRWELHRSWDVQCDGFFELPGRDAGELLDIQSNAGMTRLLARIEAAPRGAFTGTNLGWLHKSVRADHLPALARLTFHESEEVRSFAWESLGSLAEVTDRHREHTAAALLHVSVEVARERHPARPDGVPRLLVDVLQNVCVEPGVDAAWTPPFHVKRLRMWAHRWLRDCTPVPGDVPLFVRMTRTTDDMFAWSLRHVDGPNVMQALRALRDEKPERIGVLGALASHGDPAATDALVALSVESEEATAMLLAAVPHAAPGLLVETLRAADGEQRQEILWNVRYAWLDAGKELGIEPPDEAFEEFARRLDEAALVRVVPVPEGSPFHTRANAVVELGAMSDHVAPEETGEWTLALLEVAAPVALREKLRRWAASEDSRTAHLGYGLLGMLGEADDLPLPAGWDGPENAADLVDYSPAWNSEGGIPWRRLDALQYGRDARERLVAGVHEATDDNPYEALVALAIHDGLPELATGLLGADDPVVTERIEEAILAGRPVEALVHSLRSGQAYAEDVSVVQDEAVFEVLRDWQHRRELKGYYSATQELARAGDAEAEREITAVIADGFYRWVDEMSWRVMLRGDVAARVPEWFDFIETNCCQRPIPINQVFDHATDTNVDWDGSSYSTPADDARRWWRRIRGRLVWSKIARRWVPAPR